MATMIDVHEPYTAGPVPNPHGKVELEHHNDCWMCPGFNTRVGRKLMNRIMSGFKCSNCGKHTHARDSVQENCCIACKNGDFIFMPMRESD